MSIVRGNSQELRLQAKHNITKSMSIENIDPQSPRTPHDPMNPDPAGPEPLPLPPDSLPQPLAPVRQPEGSPDIKPEPAEPTRIFGFGLLED
jgi:hypothetical protein